MPSEQPLWEGKLHQVDCLSLILHSPHGKSPARCSHHYQHFEHTRCEPPVPPLAPHTAPGPAPSLTFPHKQARAAAIHAARGAAIAGGGPGRVASQHRKGKLTARQRLAVLLDPGSWLESGMYVAQRCTDFGMAKHNFPGEAPDVGEGRAGATGGDCTCRRYGGVGGAALH